MIKERTINLTVYNVYCDFCGAQGPDGLNDVGAHIVARQVGWEIIGDFYVCPSPRHAALKKMSEYLIEIRQESHPQVELPVK